jgi:hypothetical protein
MLDGWVAEAPGPTVGAMLEGKGVGLAQAPGPTVGAMLDGKGGVGDPRWRDDHWRMVP